MLLFMRGSTVPEKHSAVAFKAMERRNLASKTDWLDVNGNLSPVLALAKERPSLATRLMSWTVKSRKAVTSCLTTNVRLCWEQTRSFATRCSSLQMDSLPCTVTAPSNPTRTTSNAVSATSTKLTISTTTLTLIPPPGATGVLYARTEFPGTAPILLPESVPLQIAKASAGKMNVCHRCSTSFASNWVYEPVVDELVVYI